MESCCYQIHHKIKLHQILRSLEKRKTSETYKCHRAFWDKVNDITVESVVNRDVPTVKIFHYVDSNDHKYILMG